MKDSQRSEIPKVGARIREVRVQRRMSQAELADRANISLSQVSDIETGKSSMRLTTFIGIVEALQVSADVLLRSDIPEVNNIYQGEFAEVLADCTPSEIDSILKIVKEVKHFIHASKSHNDY